MLNVRPKGKEALLGILEDSHHAGPRALDGEKSMPVQVALKEFRPARGSTGWRAHTCTSSRGCAFVVSVERFVVYNELR